MMDERKRLILSTLIEDFIVTAEPVGSKRLVDKYGINFSTATVRNDMALLEEMGYISQPHTSAGRVPTDLGYRFYVDELTASEPAAAPEFDWIRRFYADLNREIDQLMKETSRLLSELTSCAALVYAPDIRRERIKHIDLVGLGGRGALIVVITGSGSISKTVVEFGSEADSKTLARVEKILNKTLGNVSVYKIADMVIEPNGLSETEGRLLTDAHRRLADTLSMSLSERVYYDGAAYLLAESEAGPVDRTREVLARLDRNYQLLEWLQAMADASQVIVSIGAENQLRLDGFSLVASGYQVQGQPAGVLGILGPSRMDYNRAISAVRFIAKNLGDVLAELQG